MDFCLPVECSVLWGRIVSPGPSPSLTHLGILGERLRQGAAWEHQALSQVSCGPTLLVTGHPPVVFAVGEAEAGLGN